MNWKDKMCGGCTYNVAGECRFNPPYPVKKQEKTGGIAGGYIDVIRIAYPDIEDDTPACGQWRDKDRSW
jgi:hypothetical protein